MGSDGIIGAFVILLSGWLYIAAGEIPHLPFLPLGAAFYPRVILAALGVLGALLIATDLRRTRRLGGQLRVQNLGARLKRWASHYRTILLCFGLFGLYVGTLPILGYLISTFLFVAVLQWLLGTRRVQTILAAVIVAASTSSGTYLIFEGYLRIFLPRGIVF